MAKLLMPRLVLAVIAADLSLLVCGALINLANAPAAILRRRRGRRRARR